jgi:response regulator RpfG family c-di-GMP phosphodiesterase/DNA-binding CsgD family transcriptional regulator
VQVAGPVEVFERRHGRAATREAARRHRGADFDPAVVDLFCAHDSEVLADLDRAADWAELVDAEPYLSRWVDGPELDTVLESMADLADLKSPQFAGHSRGVADLAAAAGRLSGLPDADLVTLRRAGLLHGLGRLGVSNSVWDRPTRLSAADTEHVRVHPYFTERMLAHTPALAASRQVAGRHQERLDGSGYPRGLTAASLTPLDRLLAAADAHHAMSEPRPHRNALPLEAIAAELTREVRAGRLDGDAAAAVLTASGRRPTRKRGWPAGLTSREVEVLALLARGHSNRQIAASLVITPKTAANHIAHVYTKIGVSSRAAATLFAAQNGLVGAFETDALPRTG